MLNVEYSREPEESPFEHITKDDIKKVYFRCPHCGLSHEAAVFPWTPVLAKFHCRQCDNTIEIKARDSSIDQFGDMVDEAKEDGARHAKGREFSKDAGKVVNTKFGRAALIG